ncbi:DUF1800 family protein [Massilia sp. H6]|uniref:DUF1800 family protein n=1 Tax=Massilia sp. H6 TaxID=2970464 RepID=UPI00216960D8|nr:DUF1800 family protein [Massilia sp. H6]UVW28093.1 DUF1800 family protein [Massilia sp. H6]
MLLRLCSKILRAAAPALLALSVLCAPGAHAAEGEYPDDAIGEASGEAMGEAMARHLLNRLGYGPAPGELARVRAMGLRAYVESQLAPPALPAYLDASGGTGAELRAQRLLRAVASPRQLEEVLTAFWLAHFGILEGKGMDVQEIDAIARDAVRPHVFGHYGALRAAVAQHPDMRARRIGGRGERAALRALAAHFVSAPPAALLRSLQGAWQHTGGDLRAVLRSLLTSPAFLAPAQAGSKRKDALRFVVSAVRASGIAVNDAAPLVALLARAGAPVYGRAVPMSADERACFVAQLVQGRLMLAGAAPAAHQQASSAPPLRASVQDPGQAGELARPGPVLMVAPTPSAVAMAAARNRPADPEGLRETLSSAAFLRY